MSKNQERWKLKKEGGIVWNLMDCALPHEEHLEMSGAYVSQHVRYRVQEDRQVMVEQTLVWPWLRLIPNDTHASMKSVQQGTQVNPVLQMDGRELHLTGKQITVDGILRIEENSAEGFQMIRSYYPSMERKAAVLKVEIFNNSSADRTCELQFAREQGTQRGGQGIYVHQSKCDQEVRFVLKAGSSRERYIIYTAGFLHDPLGQEEICGGQEEEERKTFLAKTGQMLKLHTEDEVLNQAFAFAKIRSTESIFNTKCGLLHSPGGLHYYGGIWTNDQAEYANPFFAFTGMEKPVASALNCYRLFRSFMGPGMECIPSSIVAEGLDIWEGKGDRGDAAMYAYGLSRFLLTLGDGEIAKEYFDSLAWSLEYCEQNKTADGVIRSDSDELEGRFPAGETNLATSCLTYEALRCAGLLAQELLKPELAKTYQSRRQALGTAIENYFGRCLWGFETYRYCETDEQLRAWICIPLTMGILNRQAGTVAALTSKKLWTADGLLTRAGDPVFWDRSTLYALRGIFAAGNGETAIKYLSEYSRRRVLGEHVPYPVEAYPEGDGRHLAAESALYARIYLEGMFGIVPEGLKVFTCCPSLPKDWHKVSLKRIQYGGVLFDLTIHQEQDEDPYHITFKNGERQMVYTCKRGEKVKIYVDETAAAKYK